MIANWIARVKVPEKQEMWVGSFEANGRTDAKVKARTGPKTVGGLAKNNGTIRALSPRAEKLLALRPTHVGFVIPKPGTTARVRTIDGKTISKVVTA